VSLENTRRSSNPIRVALVDDHRLVTDGLLAHLTSRKHGIDVSFTATSWDAMLAHDQFPVDVVVIDLHLADNIPIATKVRALNAAGSRTVVISRHADAASIHGAIRAGALAFVPKTEAVEELILAIRSAAAGEIYRNSPVEQMLDRAETVADPGLGSQELRALVLYASGRSIREVATEMATTDETVKSYIKRGRRKYRQVGIDLGTKVLLRRHGVREGWVTAE
jgi:two-component system uhpT operon response regulator UhpA